MYSLAIYPKPIRVNVDSQDSRTVESVKRCISLQQELIRHSLDDLNIGYQSIRLVIAAHLEVSDQLAIGLDFKFENPNLGTSFHDNLTHFFQITGFSDFYTVESLTQPYLFNTDLS